MKLLITAGNTLTPIDRVRAMTNVFTGRTGGRIAQCARSRGHDVTLLTSHPEVSRPCEPSGSRGSCAVQSYSTLDELRRQLEEAVVTGGFDGLIHCAAVSDYQVAGSYSLAPGTSFDAGNSRWQAETGPAGLVERREGKIKSSEPELWLRLVPTPKLIDRVRRPWGFAGVLVKFKLEVGVSEQALLDTAERARRQSDADLLVANTLEGKETWAYLGPVAGSYQRVPRADLPDRLLEAVEQLHREKARG